MLVNAANYTAPVSLRQAIQDAAKDRGILFLADNFKLILAESDPKATDPSFTIRYGRNLLKYSRSEKREDFYTHIYPYFYNGEEETYTTHPDIIFPLNGLPAKYAGLRKILPVDLTGKYGLKKGTAEDLLAFKTVINIWLEDHPFSEFPSEISLESIPDQGNTYELGLCGRVLSPEGVERHVTIVSMQYDVLRENVVNIGFDRVKKTTSDFIAAIDSIAAILRRAKG